MSTEMLKAGVIQESTPPWAAPVTLTPKKDGSYRFCIDYRKLNAVTVKDSYPLPLIRDIFDQLGGPQVFSTLDLKSGYWQIPVAPKDRYKTALTCHRRLLEFRQMPFGLANAPAVFQRTTQTHRCVLFRLYRRYHHLQQRRRGTCTSPQTCHEQTQTSWIEGLKSSCLDTSWARMASQATLRKPEPSPL